MLVLVLLAIVILAVAIPMLLRPSGAGEPADPPQIDPAAFEQSVYQELYGGPSREPHPRPVRPAHTNAATATDLAEAARGGPPALPRDGDVGTAPGAGRDAGTFAWSPREAADEARIDVSGELDLRSAPELRRALREIADEAPAVLDLHAVEFIDGAGVRAVLDGCHELGDRLRIIPGPEHVQRPFRVGGLEQTLPFDWSGLPVAPVPAADVGPTPGAA